MRFSAFDASEHCTHSRRLRIGSVAGTVCNGVAACTGRRKRQAVQTGRGSGVCSVFFRTARSQLAGEPNAIRGVLFCVSQCACALGNAGAALDPGTLLYLTSLQSTHDPGTLLYPPSLQLTHGPFVGPMVPTAHTVFTMGDVDTSNHIEKSSALQVLPSVVNSTSRRLPAPVIAHSSAGCVCKLSDAVYVTLPDCVV